MKLFRLLCVTLITLLARTSRAVEKTPLFINCGSDSVITEVGDRKWVGDSVAETNFTPSFVGIIASTSAIGEEDRYRNLYKTARIFNTTSHYNFTLASGIYCFRLHFHPFSFERFNVNDSSFDVTANDIKLVLNFNVPGEISSNNAVKNLSASSVVKEYFLNVSSNELIIEFVPVSGSFAFVSAIELIPAPDHLLVDDVNRVGNPGFKEPFDLRGRGMETIYRLNVGGVEIDSREDLFLWRRWETDERYMFSLNAANTIANNSNISYVSSSDSFAAPLLVYETARSMINNEVVEKRFNMSWRFEIEPDFDYLVRLHFCELFYDTPSQRVFKIYINNKTASENYDVFVKAGGMGRAYHEDYVDIVSRQTDTLWVQLGPDTLTGIQNTDALLNGLEIFKLSRNGNLAHGLERIDGGVARVKRRSKTFFAAIGVGSISLVAISVASAALLVFVLRKKKTSSVKRESPPGWHPLHLHDMTGSTINVCTRKSPSIGNGSTSSNRTGRRFSLGEIRAATRHFDDSLVIGSGGFGNVYKGEIEDDNLVAIKRAHPLSKQGVAEFETEIEILSKLRHLHLVSMIGYCDEEDEMILVYEYMANGTLRSHLYGTNLPPLSWKQRVDACIGAARGLHYLHTRTERGIIHRDVKTTNILLDEEFVAKIADFGLSKTGPALDHTHVSTAVKGSFGYLDPEYYRRQRLTQKSDVYSFGVVLFEVVCARPVINPELPKDQINLAEWAGRWQRQRSLETITDRRLAGDFSLESLKKFGEIAERCLCDEGKNRPTMGEVLWHLEYVQHLHEAYVRCPGEDSFVLNELKPADLSFSLVEDKEPE